jgi:hypothetical protein
MNARDISKKLVIFCVSDIRQMNQKLMVSVIGLVLLVSIPTLIQTQAQVQEQEEQIPAQYPGADANIRKIEDVVDMCSERAEAGTAQSIADDCHVVLDAFNQQMQQLFSQHKESIDHILYG